MKLKIGDKVKTIKDIFFDGGVVERDTIGSISNIIQIEGETVVLLHPDNQLEHIFALNINSVIKL